LLLITKTNVSDGKNSRFNIVNDILFGLSIVLISRFMSLEHKRKHAGYRSKYFECLVISKLINKERLSD